MKRWLWGLILFFAGVYPLHAQPKKYYQQFASCEDLYRFYSFQPGKTATLIQGHRGTVENGLPESSIAAMEYVLTRMPSVFEIDPRLTKDSVIVVFHDATLDRTTNGTGKLNDYTWEELQQFRLKNKQGQITKYRIHSLAEVLQWARGKTALVLDKKDVPLQMIADIIRKYNANSYVMNMVRSIDDAVFYFKDEPKRMFSVSMRSPEVFRSYIETGIPARQMFACIGTELNDTTSELCRLIAKSGMRCLLATASSYDKLPTLGERAAAYRKIIDAGVSIIESDYPIETSELLYVNRGPGNNNN